jgi:hypothetical protein
MIDPHWCIDSVVPRSNFELKFNKGGGDCGLLGILLGGGN